MYREVLRVTRILKVSYFLSGFLACVFFSFFMVGGGFGWFGMMVCFAGISYTALETHNEMKKGLNDNNR